MNAIERNYRFYGHFFLFPLGVNLLDFFQCDLRFIGGFELAFSDGIVKPFNPTGSKLYKVLIDTDPDDRMPRPPDPPLTQEQKALIYKWIQQGALNNVCNENYGGCDTVGVTYAGFIAPLMANKCQGCHSGANASGNIRLTTYNEVRTQALNGRLYGSISWQTGYRKMPEGGAQFSACFQNKIKAWINAGMPQ